jgi:ribosomal protein S12 methylthiotransferase accessory factor YcaO
MGRFQPGNPGKPKGAKNKFTKTVKETVHAVFNNLQEDPEHSLEAFAKKYPRDFYTIAAKLIPTEVDAKIESKVIKVIVPGEEQPEQEDDNS